MLAVFSLCKKRWWQFEKRREKRQKEMTTKIVNIKTTNLTEFTFK